MGSTGVCSRNLPQNNLDQVALHLDRDLVVLFLLVPSGVAIHLAARPRLVMERNGGGRNNMVY